MKDSGDAVHGPLRILLAGERQSGKTTCCVNTVRRLREQGARPGGVVCPKRCDKTGKVVGIEVVDILQDPPAREILARTDRTLDGPSTGAYHFSERGLSFGRDALQYTDENGDIDFDWQVVAQGNVSVTPLKLDMSDEPQLYALKALYEDDFQFGQPGADSPPGPNG